jgi:hypothetical protein
MEVSEHISGSQSPKSLVAKEERRIQDLQARISQLRKRVRSLKPVRLCSRLGPEIGPAE